MTQPTTLTIRLSSGEKDKLAALKRKTGLTQWNHLCRFAFALSLSEPSPPPHTAPAADSNVELAWRTFTGPDNDELYLACLKSRCLHDGLEPDHDTLQRQLRLHIHRGIGYLSVPKRITRLSDLIALTLSSSDTGHNNLMHRRLRAGASQPALAGCDTDNTDVQPETPAP